MVLPFIGSFTTDRADTKHKGGLSYQLKRSVVCQDRKHVLLYKCFHFCQLLVNQEVEVEVQDILVEIEYQHNPTVSSVPIHLHLSRS